MQLRASLLDADATAAGVERARPDVVLHLAGASAPAHDYSALAGLNVQGTVHLLDAVRLHAPRAKVIVASSSAVYGEGTLLREDAPFAPLTMYGVTKVAQELAADLYHRRFGLHVLRVRPFNIVGPGQPPQYAFAEFARQIVLVEQGVTPAVLQVGDLSSLRDFVDVRDVADAFIALVDAGQPGAVYNVATGEPVRVEDGLRMLINASSVADTVDVIPRAEAATPRERSTQSGDAALLRAATGWSPRYPLGESLRNTIDYWRTQRPFAIAADEQRAE